MLEFIRAYAAKHNVTGESYQEDAAADDDEEEDAAATQTGRAAAKGRQILFHTESATQKASRIIAGMLRKSLEEVIELRHSKDQSFFFLKKRKYLCFIALNRRSLGYMPLRGQITS
jgi:hypothetical protein